MQLRDLLTTLSTLSHLPDHPALNQEVKRLSTHSHACQTGDIFLGIPGLKVDGGEFWQQSIESGAICAIISESAYQKIPPTPDHCVISVTDMIQTSAEIASRFYHYPAQTLQLIGVTGTNGKTTTTHLIEYFLTESQKKAGILGTLYTRWAGYEKIASHTTPFAVDLQQQLADAVQANNQYMVMEVSSHSLAQGRVKLCPFQVSVFTNLTQDHLDFHKDMEDYFSAKALLFSEEYLKGKAIINKDDPYGVRLLDQLKDKAWSYSVHDSSADFYTSNLTYTARGVKGTLHTPEREIDFLSPLVGQFNLANLLAGIATGIYLGLDLDVLVKIIPNFSGVPGRMERVEINSNQDISVIVDYAHTPDSLENLLTASRPFIQGKMICVFGCGGDRDRTKRPKMGKIASELADITVVTSDNPRTENPQAILEDVLQGIIPSVTPLVFADRAEAIRTAILTAKAGDGVLIAGKGHEDYQILGTEKIHFDDREQARLALQLRYEQPAI